MTESTPERINHAALERIIRRAAELQTSERDTAETLSPDEVLALGHEVGIPSRYLHQALVEERARVAVRTPSGLLERVAGPGVVMAQRVVQGDADALQGALVRWMDEQELMVVQRQQSGWVTWEPLGGFQAAVRRSTAAFGRGGRKPFMLSKVDTITGTITPLEAGYCHVALNAEVKKARGEMIGWSVSVATVGAAATGVMLTLGALTVVALAPLPGALALAYGVMRQYPPRVRRVQLGLERALDHLEEGAGPGRPGARGAEPPQPPSIVNLIADEMRKAITSSRSRRR